ncbi:hypothetical protein HanIR_Chr03g0133591 [Helianthus annuus]|nr:hypothetical protein HanIR_Chr03g0133591 [Helianthus annuus]
MGPSGMSQSNIIKGCCTRSSGSLLAQRIWDLPECSRRHSSDRVIKKERKLG